MLLEEERKKKWGPYGRTKYVYQDVHMQAIKEHMKQLIEGYFPQTTIKTKGWTCNCLQSILLFFKVLFSLI